jgi:hypothetical protein
MTLLSSKKALLGILGLSSVVLASTYRDIKSHQYVEMKIDDEKEEVVPLERNVASEEAPSRVALLNLPLTEANFKKINGEWEISRIVDNTEKVVFDKFQNQEDVNKSMKIKLDLIGTGIVRIDGKNEDQYRVSILTDFGTIAIFKKIGNGYEIIEAKKVVVKSDLNNLATNNDETDLVLERAVNQSKGGKLLQGSDVSGSLTLKPNMITNFSVSLHNQNGEDQSLEIDSADLLDGGTFKTELNGEEVSGILMNNGKEGYRISFVTGPMAGAMLNFMTRSQFESIQEKEQETQRDQADLGSSIDAKNEEAQAEAALKQADAVEERKVQAENLPPEQKLTVEEVKATAEQNGFAF